MVQVWAQRLRLFERQKEEKQAEATVRQLIPLLTELSTPELASIACLLRRVFERAGAVEADVFERASELRRFSHSGSDEIDSMLADWPYLPYISMAPDLR